MVYKLEYVPESWENQYCSLLQNKQIKEYAANKIFQFTFNGDEISYKLQNKYLSMVVNEHLDCME